MMTDILPVLEFVGDYPALRRVVRMLGEKLTGLSVINQEQLALLIQKIKVDRLQKEESLVTPTVASLILQDGRMTLDGELVNILVALDKLPPGALERLGEYLVVLSNHGDRRRLEEEYLADLEKAYLGCTYEQLEQVLGRFARVLLPAEMMMIVGHQRRLPPDVRAKVIGSLAVLGRDSLRTDIPLVVQVFSYEVLSRWQAYTEVCMRKFRLAVGVRATCGASDKFLFTFFFVASEDNVSLPMGGVPVRAGWVGLSGIFRNKFDGRASIDEVLERIEGAHELYREREAIITSEARIMAEQIVAEDKDIYYVDELLLTLQGTARDELWL